MPEGLLVSRPVMDRPMQPLSVAAQRMGSGRERVWYRLAWALVLLVAVAAALLLFLVHNWSEERLRLSMEVRNQAERVHHAVGEAEKAQRAYILTEDRDFLRDYVYARSRLDFRLEQLGETAEREALPSGSLGNLRRLARERMAQLEAVLETYRAQGMAAAIEGIRENELEQTSNRIYRVVLDFTEEENRELARRERWTEVIRVLLLLALLGAIGGALALSAATLREAHGLASRLVQSNRDLEARIAERTELFERERKRVEHLLSDVSHRIGNNLSMISSYLTLQARRSGDERVKQILEDATTRVYSVASAQRRLQRTSGSDLVDVTSYLSALAEDLRSSMPDEGIEIQLDTEPLQLKGDDAVVVGIIVNELVNNAVKHAFPDMVGRISVSLRAVAGDAVLEVSDNGVGVTAEATPVGFGSSVVESLVAMLGGRAARSGLSDDPERPGTRWHIQFPAQRMRDTGERGRALRG